MKKLHWIWTYLNFWRVIPAYLVLKMNRFHEKCEKDLKAWINHYENLDGHCAFWKFGYILVNERETRNVFLNRLHRNPFMFVTVRVLFRPLDTLYINMPPENIGGGLVIQHGFSTIIAASKIGENCKIFQQVTVGYNVDKCPSVDDNVTICAGAIVIGDVHIESGVTVGAGAVVTKDVEAGKTVCGVPARVIK